MTYELSVLMLAWHFDDQTKYRIYFYHGNNAESELVEEGTFASMLERMGNDDISYAFATIFAWKVSKDGLVEIYIEPQKKHSEIRLPRLR